jgi:hypothetical protein
MDSRFRGNDGKGRGIYTSSMREFPRHYVPRNDARLRFFSIGASAPTARLRHYTKQCTPRHSEQSEEPNARHVIPSKARNPMHATSFRAKRGTQCTPRHSEQSEEPNARRVIPSKARNPMHAASFRAKRGTQCTPRHSEQSEEPNACLVIPSKARNLATRYSLLS